MSSFYGCAGGTGEGGGSGTPGVGIKSAQINELGELVFTYTNNTTQNVGNVVGAAGPKGDQGLQGYTFSPNISENILTWTNDGNLPNPEPFDFGQATEDKTTWTELPQSARITDTTYLWDSF